MSLADDSTFDAWEVGAHSVTVVERYGLAAVRSASEAEVAKGSFRLDVSGSTGRGSGYSSGDDRWSLLTVELPVATRVRKSSP